MPLVGLNKMSPLPRLSNWISFQVPNCLKKKGMPAAVAWSLNDLAQSGCMGRAFVFGPLSPPTMSQCNPCNLAKSTGPPSAFTKSRSTGPNNGSQLRKRTAAGVCTSSGIRSSAAC